MYLKRQKNTQNGHISFKIFEKISGREKLIKHLGTAKNEDEIKDLERLAIQAIGDIKSERNLPLFPKDHSRLVDIEKISIKNISVVGLHDIFGHVYDEIGFGLLGNTLLRDLVIGRIGFPGSKLKTCDYLFYYCGILMNPDNIYRFMDSLTDSKKEQVSTISAGYVTGLEKEIISLVFFDVTTLHFEAFDEDDFRKMGFSKVGKFNQPQVVVALLVTSRGIPLAYESFEGNKFEGHTLVPVLNMFKKRLNLAKLVVVADSAMLSKKNLEELEKNNYEYILGGRIKNEKKDMQKQIWEKVNEKDSLCEFSRGEQRLIVGYSLSRAAHDAKNRERAIKRLQKRIDAGDNPAFSNAGARKFLQNQNTQKAEIDQDKIDRDKKWDGLKGYVTNSKSLTPTEVLSSYGNLWQIEKDFRMSKTDLLARPIFHFRQRRIKAHLCLVFVALVVGKVAEIKTGVSVRKMTELLKLVRAVTIYDKISKQEFVLTTEISADQRKIYEAVGVKLPGKHF
ncbi:MAG: hypothetical protein A2330_11850 [Ignavibacteria bacterium RIFOXYB2_FULL_36_7]|nr:MAG: hypothetical protein A2330_11850 [Ignavibacteria bacterium RIFOXYB2_FULL_36_7]